ALKNVYLGVVSEQLNTSINPLLARIKQTSSDVWGKDIIKLAPYGLNGGVGAGAEDSDLPTAGGNNYAKFVLTLKNLYGKIELSDKAIRASSSSAGAFVNLLNAEMEGLVRASSYNFGRMLYSDGSGKLAKIVSNTTTDIVVDNVKNLMEGMVIDIVDTNGNATGFITKRITSINRATKTIHIAGASLTADCIKDKFITMQGSFGKEITGLGAIFSNTGSLYGINRSDYGWMIPYMKSLSAGSTNISDVVIQTAIDALEQDADSKVDFIVCSAGVKRNYQTYLASYRSNVDVLDLAGGYKAISYNGIPLVSDR
ncbi:MAG: phage major capsid protein, partial [Clostridia bacterium]